MKIFIITVCSRIEGGTESIETFPFKEKRSAREKFKKLVEADIEEAASAGWATEESEDSYESFEDGYEMENHYIVTLKEAELQ